jgi:membrane protein required for colicin V production
MNWVDAVILGGVGLITVAGLWSGLLMPASGIGGLVLGIILAVHHHDSLAFTLAEHLEGEAVRRIAAFVVIVLATTIAVRVVASALKKLLSYLVLGWVDRVAGALAGAALGVVAFGTAAYVIGGADIPEVRAPFQESALAVPISQASFIRASSTWCSDLDRSGPVGAGEGCTNLSSLAGELFGTRVSNRVSELLGHDVDTLADVVETSLTGSPQEIVDLVEPRPEHVREQE